MALLTLLLESGTLVSKNTSATTI